MCGWCVCGGGGWEEVYGGVILYDTMGACNVTIHIHMSLLSNVCVHIVWIIDLAPVTVCITKRTILRDTLQSQH